MKKVRQLVLSSSIYINIIISFRMASHPYHASKPFRQKRDPWDGFQEERDPWEESKIWLDLLRYRTGIKHIPSYELWVLAFGKRFDDV